MFASRLLRVNSNDTAVHRKWVLGDTAGMLADPRSDVDEARAATTVSRRRFPTFVANFLSSATSRPKQAQETGQRALPDHRKAEAGSTYPAMWAIYLHSTGARS